MNVLGRKPGGLWPALRSVLAWVVQSEHYTCGARRLAQRREEIGSVIATVVENTETTEGRKGLSGPPKSLAALLLYHLDGLALQKILNPNFVQS